MEGEQVVLGLELFEAGLPGAVAEVGAGLRLGLDGEELVFVSRSVVSHGRAPFECRIRVGTGSWVSCVTGPGLRVARGSFPRVGG